MSATEVAAWWGAGIATLVLVWDVYKWRVQGPRISFTVSAGWKLYGNLAREEGTYVTVRVTNRGTRAATITNMGLLYYKSGWQLVRGRPQSQMVISGPGLTFPLPHVLDPGGIWDGAAIQDQEVDRMLTDGRLYCVIFSSHRQRPYKKRVRPKLQLPKKPSDDRSPPQGTETS